MQRIEFLKNAKVLLEAKSSAKSILESNFCHWRGVYLDRRYREFYRKKEQCYFSMYTFEFVSDGAEFIFTLYFVSKRLPRVTNTDEIVDRVFSTIIWKTLIRELDEEIEKCGESNS